MLLPFAYYEKGGLLLSALMMPIMESLGFDTLLVVFLAASGIHLPCLGEHDQAFEWLERRMPLRVSATESPYYSYKGRLVWFGLCRKHIGLYLRPPVIEERKKELVGYETTKSALHASFTCVFPS